MIGYFEGQFRPQFNVEEIVKQKQVPCPESKLGEQLTGLSPTVCRRAIAAIRQEDERLGGENRTVPLPSFCHGLVLLITKQTYTIFSAPELLCERYPHNRTDLLSALNQAELFLNIVEGVEPAKAQKPAGDHIPPGTFDDRETMEEAAGRG